MKYLATLLIALCAISASAQQQAPKDSIPYELRKQAYIYTLAKKYNDPDVARMALYNLIATNPNSSAVLDSLALLYFDYQQYASAALVAQDAMKIDPNDLFATEVAAVAFDNLGVKTRAVNNYEKLYLANNDLGTLYKIAFLQLELKRHGEAINNADVIIASPKSDELKLVFPIDNSRTQEISLKAATVRMKGMIEADKGNTSLARELYQKALDMEPDFAMLKEQIAALDKK
ncbi:MAG: hypothetical protein RIC30_11465 [Marinoscillum sp.]|uniref:tetratricopeptide repeat protein n=1 Tax=Marinoscillum sp. TaxID=2024838 RepID=UPI00330434E8